jgi:hypothetical protein
MPFVVSPGWFIVFTSSKNNKLYYRMTNGTLHPASFPLIHDNMAVKVGNNRKEIANIVLPTAEYTVAHGSQGAEPSAADKLCKKIASWGGNNAVKRRQILMQHIDELAEFITSLTDDAGAAEEICHAANIPATVAEEILQRVNP